MAKHETSFIGRGIYSVPDAAQLIGLTANRVRRWTNGYEFTDRGRRRWSPPIIGHVERNAKAASSLSFLDLIEVLYCDFFLSQGVTIQRIRRLHDKSRKALGTGHPFATHRFRTDGKWILEEEIDDERLYNHLTEQIEDHRLLRTVLRGDLDLDQKKAVLRWWPLGGRHHVVLDPLRGFGAPIVSTEGVPTQALYGTYRAEGSYRKTASWWQVSLSATKAAVKFEQDLRRAA